MHILFWYCGWCIYLLKNCAVPANLSNDCLFRLSEPSGGRWAPPPFLDNVQSFSVLKRKKYHPLGSDCPPVQEVSDWEISSSWFAKDTPQSTNPLENHWLPLAAHSGFGANLDRFSSKHKVIFFKQGRCEITPHNRDKNFRQRVLFLGVGYIESENSFETHNVSTKIRQGQGNQCQTLVFI